MTEKTEITARYAETDQMGIIHHSVYPIWFEVSRTNLIKKLGISYSQIEKDGVMLPVCELKCKYIKPVHYEDEVIVETKVSKVSFAKISFSYRVLMKNTNEVMVTGETILGFVSSKTFKPLNLKKENPQFYNFLCLAQENN